MSDVLLPLDAGDELRRLTLASAIRDVTLARLEMALARERAKKAALLEVLRAAIAEREIKAALLEAAKAVLEWAEKEGASP